MNRKGIMAIVTALIIAVVLFAGTVIWYYMKDATGVAPTGSIACTQEARQCPDGSYVGRTGTGCAFAVCPVLRATTTTDSGIRGTVMLGPTCPVERIPPDPSCADRPYRTMVSVFSVNDPARVLFSGSSDASGIFSILVPPGEYVLGAGEKPLPRCDHPQVTVNSRAFSSATISCDTGIR